LAYSPAMLKFISRTLPMRLKVDDNEK
jgi:hypothetical protein